MKKPRILFVCLGNICRSPTAEAIFRKRFLERKIDAEFDSAGTGTYHIGSRSDGRSIRYAQERGYEMNHRARQVTLQDFEDFDSIFAMDASNLKNLMAMCPSEHLKSKIELVTDYSEDKRYSEVPDPYCGDESNFNLVIDILESCVDSVIRWKKY